MKKICYLLCMICALGVFNACSDDDDDATPSIPVTEIVVPAKVQAGGELIIAGNGFAADCKIFLKNDAQSVELTISERLSASVSCSVPATLAPGEYTVVLVQKGEWPLRKITILEEGAGVDMPVTAIVPPAEPIVAGEKATFQGIGFAKDCEIYLKVGDDLQNMKATPSNTGVTFTVPETLPEGVYPVVLKQDGGQWTLGEITVKAKAAGPKTQIDKITEKWTKKEIEHKKVSSYTYTEGKISLIEVTDDGEPDRKYEFIRESGKLTVKLFLYNPSEEVMDYDEPDVYEYTLNAAGNAESLEVTLSGGGDPSSETWVYTTDGYLESQATGEKYTYENKCLTGFHYRYEDGDYFEDSKTDFDYTANQANQSVLDLMGEVLYYSKVIYEAQYFARIAGICGPKPELLPSSITMTTTDSEYPDEPAIESVDITYTTYPEDGNIHEIQYNDGHTFEVTYK